jgi:hypothetical protein
VGTTSGPRTLPAAAAGLAGVGRGRADGDHRHSRPCRLGGDDGAQVHAGPPVQHAALALAKRSLGASALPVCACGLAGHARRARRAVRRLHAGRAQTRGASARNTLRTAPTRAEQALRALGPLLVARAARAARAAHARTASAHRERAPRAMGEGFGPVDWLQERAARGRRQGEHTHVHPTGGAGLVWGGCGRIQRARQQDGVAPLALEQVALAVRAVPHPLGLHPPSARAAWGCGSGACCTSSVCFRDPGEHE